MPDWVLSVIISLGGFAATAATVGIAWGTLAERVANLKEEVKTKASTESMGHLEKGLDEIKAMLQRLLSRGDDG